MADPVLPIINQSEILSGIWASMPPQFSSGIGFLITIAKAIGIIFLIYLIFLLIQSIVRIREALRMKAMAKNIEEINQKLSLLVASKKIQKEHKNPKGK